ncbi:unannotated protein [freshwater metagenome]|uniref:Unannotated protein n=1 Tax=freshwater metagenome TaxID=449393 RepID=A0A6J6TJU7_9ZZZZ
MIHDEAKREQDAALKDPGSYGRVTDGAEKDGVLRTELRDHLLGQQLTGGVVSLCAEVVFSCLDGDVGERRDRKEDLHGLGDNLSADAVAGDEGKVQGA